MPRVLLLATTTGYQTRSFADAAQRSGVDVRLATDRCHMLDDPWQDAAIPIRFHEEDEAAASIAAAASETPFDGLIAVGDRPTVVAALAAQALGLPGHSPDAARIARSKLHTRERFATNGLLVPWFRTLETDADASTVAATLRFPCIVKPLSLSGSRGVMRADDERSFLAAIDRLRRLLQQKDVAALRDPLTGFMLVEGYIPGAEFALEGILEHGELRVLALFDKPDPLDGPFFEETIYVTPSRLPEAAERGMIEAVDAGARALGLWHGPIHAECRVNDRGVYVLEIAARPIGGLCARALRFQRAGHSAPYLWRPASAGPDSWRPALAGPTPPAADISFEELLLRHAIGEPVSIYGREARAASVMMIPIPREGYLKGVEGIAEALAVQSVEEIHITAKPDQRLVPLPEGSSYLGFIFARATTPDAAVEAVRAAHAKLRFAIEPAVPVL